MNYHSLSNFQVDLESVHFQQARGGVGESEAANLMNM